MIIKAGETTINTGNIYGEKVYHEGMARPALRVDLSEGITPKQIADLGQNDWQIFDPADLKNPASVQKGYTYMHACQITFICMSDPEVIISDLQATIEKERMEKAALQSQLNQEAERANGLELAMQTAVSEKEAALSELQAARTLSPLDGAITKGV